MYVFAPLSIDQIQRVQEFERAEGIRLLALKEVQVEPELLPADKLMALNELEKNLGVCLLAVR
ncbi:MAG TPA: hypothetical protein PKO36_04465 [Candidatus Hydrogenedentes bacterium]|nr:hypothetical protein [Candidatus Hydrogenedentota bacterium]HOT50450.1 hypothetical protein [Candidatus Hydrogenedentota bacterium]HOV75349.1 hypothetical protein [Candidatus Hydrogenedentota bacterium]HPC15593.1 hypothetical protein [Candidatus Hydrogenedentota bacterium]HRT19413.1 hypothetical protein [Candidatus Hydrogenedentota bacterium]